MVELESQEAVTVASTADIAVDVSLRLLAAATSLAAAVVVAANHQQRWGIRVDFTLFQWLRGGEPGVHGVRGGYAVCRLYRRYCNAGAAALALSLAAVLLLGVACARSRYPKMPPTT
uniref:CASP-like protein n=1 Tax=Oryza barthii TaxID=65489 RepID=A0A0D3H2L5_9ORYZ